MMADALGVDLAIITPSIGRIDVTRSNAAGLPRPYARCFSQTFDARARGRAEHTNADAFFSGGGGDNVFCYLQSLSPLVDRLQAEGGRPRILATIKDLADLGNTNVWTIVLRTLRRLMHGPKAPWYRDTRLLHQDVAQTACFPQGHPWTLIPSTAPPGKVAHVAALIAFQNHLEGHGRSAFAPIISPLLSQPIMETCLAIPSWLWCSGGNNRAVARAAFASALPAPVLARRSKGAFDSLAAQLVEANRAPIRTLLLDGCLASQGVLEPDAVLCALDTADPSLTVRLLQLVDTESWARSWTITARSAPPP
jgi:asparagine synthase (glutamine-hydrolysing)